MIAPFEFATATQIVFGAGGRASLASHARRLGTRAFVVTLRADEPSSSIIEALDTAGLSPLRWRTLGEPSLSVVREATAAARSHTADLVVGCGGGSAIDLGKAVAALLTNPGDPLDYVEVVGRGQPLAARPVPFIAMPTTAGTGAEVTRNAVIGVPESRVKVSLRSPLMLPAVALVDPELTLGLPRDVTVWTGMDALTQLIEPFVSARANPLTDAICVEALPRAAAALRRAVADPSDLDARTEMAFASLSSGLALANAGLGAVHGYAAAIGGRFDAAHGAICAALLPHVMAANVRALERADARAPLERYATVARLVTGRPSATARDGVEWVAALAAELGIPPLGAYGIGPADLDDIVAAAARASSMKANPVVLDAGELRDVLSAAV